MLEGLWVDVAIGDENRVKSFLLHRRSNVVHELVPDGWLVVGKGHTITCPSDHLVYHLLLPTGIPKAKILVR